MNKAKMNASLFDDDFEVTFEEDVPFTYNFETKPADRGISGETVVIPSSSRKSKVYDETDFEDDYEDNRFVENDFDDDDFENEGIHQGNSRSRHNDIYDDDDDYDRSSYSPQRSAARAKRSRSFPRASSLLSPAKKTAKYGTKAIYHVARSVVRIVSLMITAGTLGMLAYNFWRGAAPYGDPQTILTDKNYALVSYAAVAAVFLLFELIALFWSMTRMRIREGRKVYKEDTGRGLFSYVFIYIASYVSFLLCSFLPDTLGSYAVLNGIKGALDVFGSLHNVLLGLCAAGVISCLVRRHML